MSPEEELSDLLAGIQTLASRIEMLNQAIPGPAFDPETDAPLNPAGALQAGLESLLDEELQPAATRVRRLLLHLPSGQLGSI